MIHLDRSPEPQILINKKTVWLSKFLASSKSRPDNSKYAHTDIKNDLYNISHHKCFYCERQLKEVKEEIDHHIEVDHDQTLAFEWTNLYLSCDNCNDKTPHKVVPVNSVLDPFRNTNEEIEEHITFEKEVIRINNASDLGNRTIKKFKLDSKQLDFLRAKFLIKFYEEYTDLMNKCRNEGNRPYNQDEREGLLKYSYEDHPFSLMFKILLRRKGIL